MTSDARSYQDRAKAEAGTAVRFAIVGGVATLTHSGVALLLLQSGLLPAFLANTGGFVIAFAVSFLGHHHWSFRTENSGAEAGRRMRRFFLLALAGFALNSSVLAGWLGLTSWPESLGILFSIAVVPALTFLGARLWAFSAKPDAPVQDKS
ncbi:GtrA family protein [uncultured Roseibium sp.]|uniref:GtrA family protein n=1 Tax=uncultured Roseibium sp. TaxID=1936171 RepID=UPI00259A3668|nr:GtrA family protein [uncultured Roseibium sp.]